MPKISQQTALHYPRTKKHTRNQRACQAKQENLSARTPSEIVWRCCILLSVIVLIAGWVVLALMTQSFFLLSSIPLLARELGYSLHKLVDIALPLP